MSQAQLQSTWLMHYHRAKHLPVTTMSLRHSFYRLHQPLMGALLTLASVPSLAISYGIYDARGLAMGGSATTIGSHAQAVFYNPALLALHDRDEDAGLDGRGYFPAIVVQVSDPAESALDAMDNELDAQLSNAITAFNGASTSENARQVAATTQTLRDTLDTIANKNLNIDAFIGFTLSEPSDHEGGAFYFGARFVSGGIATVTQADRTLLDGYLDTLQQLAAGVAPGTVATQHPTLIAPNGQLIDATRNLSSHADISALAINEWGVAIAKQFAWRQHAIAIGVTPKLMRVDAFRDTAALNDNLNSTEAAVDSFSDTRKSHVTFNADMGITALIQDNYRVSLTLKDGFAKRFSTRQAPDPTSGEAAPDLSVKLSSRARFGLGYVNEKFSLGMDYDLNEAKPMGSEAGTQELSLGAEYRLFETLALRLGYRRDQQGLYGNLISGGIGYQWKRIVLDMAYASSAEYRGGAFQFGWAF